MLQCPLCNNTLQKEGNTWRCQTNHSFDLSKRGAVNLLLSQRSKKRNHGDDRGMVTARTRFLNAGHYQGILDAIVDNIPTDVSALADLGCGEGWYTESILKHFAVSIFGIDVSKTAIDEAAKRSDAITWIVGSTFALPFAAKSMNAMWSVFAPFDPGEVNRVLSDSGVFIQVIPKADHLFELKAAIYDEVRENDPVPVLEGFDLKRTESVTYSIKLDSQQEIQDLFAMTPYVYRTPKHLKERLSKLETLNVRVSCDVRIYARQAESEYL